MFGYLTGYGDREVSEVAEAAGGSNIDGSAPAFIW